MIFHHIVLTVHTHNAIFDVAAFAIFRRLLNFRISVRSTTFYNVYQTIGLSKWSH